MKNVIVVDYLQAYVLSKFTTEKLQSTVIGRYILKTEQNYS